MSYAKKRAEGEPIGGKPKKFRVIILLWEVEPELRFHKGELTSASHFIKIRKRFEKEFNSYSQAVSIFNFLHKKLRSYWHEVMVHR